MAGSCIERGVHAATALAEAMIPPDMVEFLARWPFAFDTAKDALSFALGQPADAVSPAGARIRYGTG